MRPILLFFALLAVTSLSSFASEDESVQVIRIPQHESGKDELFLYYHGLLALALGITEEKYGKADIEIEDIPTLQSRQIMGLKSALTDVIWGVSTGENEKDFIAVSFPLSGNLFSYRILVVNKTDARFSKPLSIDQLKRLTAVQGRHWPDYEVMTSNGFNVSGAEFHMAYRLLETEFVDYFPRSTLEVCEELLFHPNAVIYPSIALYYPNVIRFYVNKDRPELAKRIKEGLDIAYSDGIILHRLMSQPFFRDFATLVSGKRIIKLKKDVSEQTQALLQHPLIEEVSKVIKALPEDWQKPDDTGQCSWRGSNFNPPDIDEVESTKEQSQPL